MECSHSWLTHRVPLSLQCECTLVVPLVHAHARGRFAQIAVLQRPLLSRTILFILILLSVSPISPCSHRGGLPGTPTLPHQPPNSTKGAIARMVQWIDVLPQMDPETDAYHDMIVKIRSTYKMVSCPLQPCLTWGDYTCTRYGAWSRVARRPGTLQSSGARSTRLASDAYRWPP